MYGFCCWPSFSCQSIHIVPHTGKCIIDREQVLLIKEDNWFKYQLLNKSGSKYLTSSKAAKFKHVDLLIDDKHRLYKSNDSKFEETYNKVRTELKPK